MSDSSTHVPSCRWYRSTGRYQPDFLPWRSTERNGAVCSKYRGLDGGSVSHPCSVGRVCACRLFLSSVSAPANAPFTNYAARVPGHLCTEHLEPSRPCRVVLDSTPRETSLSAIGKRSFIRRCKLPIPNLVASNSINHLPDYQNSNVNVNV